MAKKFDTNEDCIENPENLKRLSCTSSTSSTMITGIISLDLLQIWSQLPDTIRMDSSLDVFKKEYEKILKSSPLMTFTTRDYLFPNELSVRQEEAENHKRGKEHSVKNFNARKSKFKCIMRYTKMALLVTCCIAFSITLMITEEKKENYHVISVPNNDIKKIGMLLKHSTCRSDKISVTIEGSSLVEKDTVNISQTYLSIWLSEENDKFNDIQVIKNISEEWILPLAPSESYSPISHRRINTFILKEDLRNRAIVINLKSNSRSSVPLMLSYNLTPLDVNKGLAFGTFLLIGFYVIIMFDLVHRTIAALLAATGSLAILSALNQKPTMSQIISWVDFDTIMLLFSMMVLVAIVADSGALDYFAVFAYKITHGKVLPLVSMLCFFTAFVSAVLDNVTVIMLIIPATIKICEVIKINPVSVIIIMVMFSNIGGAMTPVGDPPNVIIASNRRVIAAGIDFGTFTLHMTIGVLLALVILYGHFRFIFRNIDKLRFQKPKKNQELQQEINKWQMMAVTLTSHNKGDVIARDVLLNKIKELLQKLQNKVESENNCTENFETTVKELKEKYKIRDKCLLVKSGICMALVIILFSLHSSPSFHLSIGSIAFLCILLLLIIADNKTFDDLLTRVEWSTLLFFAALFILMEALTELGLISWIGDKTESIILSVSEESRLSVAILLLLWVSAFAGALVDNVPLATMMVKIVTGIAENSKLKLPLQPLVWALCFGCLGGNGTLIGATTNVVCAGVAEQYGYRVTFMQFFKIGFPVLLTSTLTISVYLIIAHVIFEWNN
ncbi:P protein [Copidosoma floridanum]|uniref:P protein n=1 Tax=Copidosoma floridanum TaxID=29053 RepID=UPI000C6F71CF|nr:P protein [Copidosoma floridanum]